MNEKVKCRKHNTNAGMTLVEIIVTIAIISVLAGTMSISLSLMFSRDAERVGKKINDELSEARLMSMSKAGVFTLTIHTSADGKSNYIQLDCDNAGTVTTVEHLVLEKNAVITYGLEGSLCSACNSDLKIVFDKANGSVKSINGATVNGLYQICSKGTHNDKVCNVYLVTTTGRHYIE